MSEKLNFQEIILRLLDYWKEQGCLVWQPYNIQVGAGTMNPATTLRVLGPEPWNVVYVEPSIRPDDGRFGDNPNRMQQHYQLQVILQPDPGNPQELYLKSLEAIGIDPRQHDIRFVEDNWESPALGAWGLGWEVWLDGQEITQFTYFQQAGGVNLDPVAVEITYGLDRIALALQGVDAVWDMEYGAGISYGDALLQAEIEQCRYYFEVADVEALQAIYDTYEREARRCLAAGLVTTAHDYNLKCSHLFNVLDTRGAVGVTERANYFRRMRNIARQVAEMYLEQRQRLEYPFLDNPVWQVEQTAAAEDSIQLAQVETTQSFLLEIGSEELPAGDLTAAQEQLETLVPQFLNELRLIYDEVEIHGTPRRLAVLVHGLQGRQADLEREVKGPPAERAFDAEGRPTRAAIGFARSRGVDAADLKVVEDERGRYVAAQIHEEGRPAALVLAQELPSLLAAIKFDKSMRWNSSNVSFSRPIRWLVALYGPDVVPFGYAGVRSDRISRGLRPYDSPEIRIDDAADYLQLMAVNGIVIDAAKRREIITANGRQLAAERGGTIPDDPRLVEEVTNLVERPALFSGRFEERYLKLPAEVLVAVMRKHQRYFPVYGRNGQLRPYFVAVRNGDNEHLDIVIDGNEHVIRARFADAEFFYQQDIKRKLVDFIPELASLTVHTKVGSMLDKTRRLEMLAPLVAEMLHLTPTETEVARRAAALAKTDLASKMVVEMTSLQGVIGAHYARLSGEEEPVAAAIGEQYNAVSQTRPGLALALADRLDSLVGLFAAGLAPKGSNDPFALRRAAIQLLENLIANEIEFDLRPVLAAAGQMQAVDAGPAVVAEVMGFINGRLEVLLSDAGYSPAVVRAVLTEQGHNPYGASRAAAALAKAIREPDWPQLLDAYARCVRITRDQPRYTLQPAALDTPQAQALYAAYQVAAVNGDGTVEDFVADMRALEPVITVFFDNVMVNVDDAVIRENRLALLQQIADLARGVADLSQLEGF